MGGISWEAILYLLIILGVFEWQMRAVVKQLETGNELLRTMIGQLSEIENKIHQFPNPDPKSHGPDPPVPGPQKAFTHWRNAP
jgi:hypothetical protein